ncbi:MAG TPA: polymer-forming cytoskeletal protein, partial [Burkholderiales bacterium]|nr:polymer-forming cytoskeletal protein [Burkholderiales bacterium]
MLQKDGFFRRREEGQFRPQNQPINPAPATPTAAAPLPTETRAEARPAPDERKEAKLVVGPQIKIKGVEISDCDTLVVEGRIEATLDS